MYKCNFCQYKMHSIDLVLKMSALVDTEVKCDLLKKIITDLQCFNCQDVPRPQNTHRYECIKRGHLLCKNCKSECPCYSPVCVKPLKLVETLTCELPWHCNNLKNGCHQIFQDEEKLQKHERNCVSRLIFCPDKTCLEQILFKDLMEHVGDEHKSISSALKIDSQSFLAHFDTETMEPMILELSSDLIFFLVGQNQDGMTYFWVYFLGSINNIFNYTISIKTKNNSVLGFKGKVLTLDECSVDIIEKNLLFCFESRKMSQMLTDEDSIDIQIAIHEDSG